MLEVKKINVLYGKIHVLKDVSLKVQDGECVTLLGANGAGKSTLINAICGLVPPASGSITIDGLEISHVRSHEIVRKGISQVPEGRQIFPHLSVKDNLILGAYTRYKRATRANVRQDIEDILTMFPRLKERIKQLAGILSGG